MIVLISLMIGASVVLVLFSVIPPLMKKLEDWREQKEAKVAKQLDQLYYDKGPKQTVRLYFILPPLFCIALLIIFKSFLLAIIGALAGLFIPNLILKMRHTQRLKKFNNQILDAIMIMSSSLKGGLSLLQALEVLIEEMPAPMAQEIGLVVRENKMGVSLEDSLKHLNKRMNMEELNLVINSILVARETGGELTKVFSRLTTTIRDNRKLKDSIKTLTMQGRMQGLIMSVLPFLFIFWVINFNREHFDIMLQSEIGRTLLFIAGILQIAGMFLIRKFSAIKI